MGELPHRPLGESGIEVSCLALGSWRTYERIPPEEGIEVMRTARDRGIDLLDDARYNDETGSAPIPTGYSEVVFGELFGAAGWHRDEVTVTNKLWWEFWPDQTAAEELDASLGRMGLDHIDLIYAESPPEGLALPDLVEQVGGLIATGKARVWGVLNWPGERIAAATSVARELGVAPPCAAQLAYSLVDRSQVEDPAVVDALQDAGASVVASYTLAGGTLTGKYVDLHAAGRMTDARDDPAWQRAFRAGEELSVLARDLGTTAASLAIAFALANPVVASVLFGATNPRQIDENLGALDVLDRLTGDELSELQRIGVE
jgi:L-glyceraldehyde 3-phosphate reductase